MLWLFERTVELAAWLALVLFWGLLGFAVYHFALWCGSVYRGEGNFFLLRDAGIFAAAAVGSALVLGGLACVDRFLFDADEPR